MINNKSKKESAVIYFFVGGSIYKIIYLSTT